MSSHTDTQDFDQTQTEEQRATGTAANCPSPVSKLATPPATFDDGIQQGITVLDFSIPHSQALSTDYIRLPTSTPHPLPEDDESVQKKPLVIWPHQPSTRGSPEPSEPCWLASGEALSETDDIEYAFFSLRCHNAD